MTKLSEERGTELLALLAINLRVALGRMKERRITEERWWCDETNDAREAYYDSAEKEQVDCIHLLDQIIAERRERKSTEAT